MEDLRCIILLRHVLCFVRMMALILLNRFKLFFSISVALSKNDSIELDNVWSYNTSLTLCLLDFLWLDDQMREVRVFVVARYLGLLIRDSRIVVLQVNFTPFASKNPACCRFLVLQRCHFMRLAICINSSTTSFPILTH